MTSSKDLTKDQWSLWSQWMTAQQLVARAIDKRLQRDAGISKAEFSVLMTLYKAPGHEVSIAQLIASLDWEKSRLAHQLTRMEGRGLVAKVTTESGRRSAVGMTEEGDRMIRRAITVHSQSVREYFVDTLTKSQAEAIRLWCESIMGAA